MFSLLSAASVINVENLLDRLLNYGIELGKSLLAALVIYIIGRFIIKYILRFITSLMVKRKVEISVQTFLRSLLKIVLNLILAFAIISKLGVETTSFAALLASAGVAIGMALSGNLSNFAGGLIILVFKPFKVGDYIDAPGGSGTVKEIQIFHTVLTTPDNKAVYIPNGSLSSGMVTNFSREQTRRVDWVFGVEYGSDFEQVKQCLLRILEADDRILKDPQPFIVLGALADSSVNLTVRVWVKSADYWDVYFQTIETVYTTFNKEGIGFPFPQLTVHSARD